MNKIKYAHNGDITVAMMDFDPALLTDFGVRLDFRKLDKEFNNFKFIKSIVKRYSEDESNQELARKYAREKLIRKRNKIYRRLIINNLSDLDLVLTRINMVRFHNQLVKYIINNSELKIYDITGAHKGFKYSHEGVNYFSTIFEQVYSTIYPGCSVFVFKDDLWINGYSHYLDNCQKIEGKVYCSQEDTFDRVTGLKLCDKRFYDKVNHRADVLVRNWSKNIIKIKENIVNNFNRWCKKYHYEDFMV